MKFCGTELNLFLGSTAKSHKKKRKEGRKKKKEEKEKKKKLSQV
jgi:hypothetical protein